LLDKRRLPLSTPDRTFSFFSRQAFAQHAQAPFCSPSTMHADAACVGAALPIRHNSAHNAPSHRASRLALQTVLEVGSIMASIHHCSARHSCIMPQDIPGMAGRANPRASQTQTFCQHPWKDGSYCLNIASSSPTRLYCVSDS
jgi:hypothetical protein